MAGIKIDSFNSRKGLTMPLASSPVRSMLSLIFLFYCCKQKPLYHAIFKTEIHTSTKLIFKNFVPKSKEDSMLVEFSRQLISNMQAKEVHIMVSDSLTTFADSTVIITKASSSEVSGFSKSMIESKNSTLILKNNKLFTRDERGTINILKNNRNTSFLPTRETETIVGFKTNKYLNEDRTISIWCTKDLPDLLNPGILVNDPQGGILKYEIIEDGQKITSIAEKIIKE